MPPQKPLPLVPATHRRVKFDDDEDPVMRSPPHTTIGPTPNMPRKRSPPSPRVATIAEYMDSDSSEYGPNMDSEDERADVGHEINSRKSSKHLRGNTTLQSDDVTTISPTPVRRKLAKLRLIEDQLAELEEENMVLRQQIREVTNAVTFDKDRVIALLRKQNHQFVSTIEQQNRLVARIANTISLSFQEYLEAAGLRGANEGERDSQEESSEAQNRSSNEIRVYSQFEEDSDSDA